MGIKIYEKERLEEKNKDIEKIIKKIKESDMLRDDETHCMTPGEYNKEWNEFTKLIAVYYELLRFKDYYISNIVDYFNKGKTNCSKNSNYECKNCPVMDLTPWCSDIYFRCPNKK